MYYWDEAYGGFPRSKEKLGRWCGPTENCGDSMTFWIYSEAMNQILARSVLRSALPTDDSNRNTPVNLRAFLDNEYVSPSDLEGSSSSLDDGSTTLGDKDVPRLPSGKLPKETFTSLKEKISKAKGEVTAMPVDPIDHLGYSFIKETKDGDKVKATVTAIDKDIKWICYC